MPDLKKISWNLSVQVDKGPQFSAPNSVEIEAYDVVETVVPKKNGNAPGKIEVGIQPNVAANVKLILINVLDNKYSDKLSYSVETDEADAKKRIILDAAQFLVGTGAVGLFKKKPDKFFIYNNQDEEVTVQILVGRKATA
jgi:hypothetical protein